MKLSKSLLDEKEIGQKIFKSGLNKAKNLLTDVFDLDFRNGDSKIINIEDDSDNLKYEILFDMNGRKITALFTFEEYQDDILREVLIIRELVVVNIPVEEVPNDIDKTIIKIMEILEEKYGINFTPLDPENEDKNIKEINTNEKNDCLKVIFTSEDHEAKFKAEFKYKQGKMGFLKIEQHKEHLIYFE
ncbi:hypothetical protein [Clostridium estertheticum]|uniref:hypothetical protein n=1 Tax=Clostridium estertheticum TaxID=238834 RepID=UPI001C0DE2FE|nr:hypothetical protein [Clostridium estertheticum]MBU3173278.1 hypothetical protein [Clostridium estertheticum]